MRILGIDPGLNTTGYGVIASEPDRLRLVAAGTVCPSAAHPLSTRLGRLYDGVNHVIGTQHPTLVVLEALYTHHHYLTTAALMAHARGVICLLSAQHHLPLVEYLPTRIKKALTGYGSASKDQVSRAVGRWLGVETQAWASDVTDALALAIAHAQISRTDGILGGVTRRRRRIAVSDTRRTISPLLRLVSDTETVK
ncbi:MAG: crossover junction endodeoxyribonuclease RuvC [Candidatus Omnitrophica bacterium]|nr:crossover junction endodeoxyribonuclease RuvC [Candidatus Omnitrophota bacterium]